MNGSLRNYTGGLRPAGPHRCRPRGPIAPHRSGERACGARSALRPNPQHVDAGTIRGRARRVDYLAGNRCDVGAAVRSWVMDAAVAAGTYVREWRKRRRMSQMTLALGAEI